MFSYNFGLGSLRFWVVQERGVVGQGRWTQHPRLPRVSEFHNPSLLGCSNSKIMERPNCKKSSSYNFNGPSKDCIYDIRNTKFFQKKKKKKHACPQKSMLVFIFFHNVTKDTLVQLGNISTYYVEIYIIV
jgi:hypothetical protein